MTSSDSGETPENPEGQGDLPPTHQPYGRPADNPYGPPPSQNPYGQPAPPPSQDPYGQPGAPQYGQPPQGQPPYGAPQYGAPQPGHPPYGGQPQQGYGYGTPVAANHPSATTALVLSLIGLVGIALCGGLTLVLSPFAWRIGARAVREIDAEPGRYGGRDQANAGRIMGIIGTVLLVLGLLLLVGLFALIAVGSTTSTSRY